MRNVNTILVGKPEGEGHSEEPDIVGNTILEWLLGKEGGKVWTGFMCLRTGTSGRLL
jgi:hypothetical protein